MVRGFRLLNEKGQSYSLMDIQNNCLLTDPNRIRIFVFN
nr:MAG TPA: Baseplate protein [Caudoviricetes sp.]DAS21343.1 MAG TPA: Baseplate protein [Caudoviricetes sp.]